MKLWSEGYKCTKKIHFLLYQKRCHNAQIKWPYACYVTLGSRWKMANSSSEDETWYFARDPQGYSRISLSLPGRILKEYRYSMGFVKSHSLKCSLHKWAWCGTARKSNRLNCINLIHVRLTASWLRGSSCIVIPGVVCELLQFTATQYAGIINFFVDHMHTQFTEQSKMATALTPQTDVTSGKSRDWWRTRDCSFSQPTENKID